MPTHDSSRSDCAAKVALCVGGGGDPLTEYSAAREMCRLAERQVGTFVCNDTIPVFPDFLDHAVTLHPDKMPMWRSARLVKGLNDPPRQWCHRSYEGFSDWTRDWQGSSGLLCLKIARELGYTHIILCGIPMTIEAQHFLRHRDWNAAQGFVRGWRRREHKLKEFVRSLSGWTREVYGEPTEAWLREEIPDPRPLFPEHLGLTA